MAEILNPYIAGNPITGSEMFFGRDDVFAFIHQALTGKHQDNVLVLYGQRRTGKTSVLYQMRHHLEDRYLPIFIDLHGLAIESLSGFILELANIISRGLRRGYGVELPPLDRAEFTADARNAFETTFLEGIWERIGERQLLLMLDEAIRLEEQVRAGKLDPDIFDYLRHLMQHHPRLNFLFSLGSGLEEMEKEYAFLFNVALYKKISFLDRGSAVDLITRPVENIYHLDPDAIERILEVTSGHPYYTQLICHGLFNHCVSNSISSVTVGEIDAVLDEAVERGLAVLKHVWEESSPPEKAVLAGLSAVLASGPTAGEPGPPVGLVPADERAILNAWASLGETVPRGEVASAVKHLIARDVIVDSPLGGYRFTVELQRMWVLKYRRLDWTQEEIKDWLGSLPKEQRPSLETKPPTPAWYQRPAILLPLALVSVCIGVILIFLISRAWITENPDIIAGWLGTGGTNNNSTLPDDALLVNSLLYNDGYAWAATVAGVVRWSDDGTSTYYSGRNLGLFDNCTNTIAAAPDGSYWVGCGGVAHVGLADGDIASSEFFNQDDGLGMGLVRNLLVESDGSVWASGSAADPEDHPLSFYDGQNWHTDIPVITELDQYRESWNVDGSMKVRSMMMDGDGHLWLGSDDISKGGILRWNGDHYENYVYTGEGTGNEDRRVRSLLQDQNGNIWVAAGPLGLLNLILDTGEFIRIELPNYDGAVYFITEFSDGSLWVGGDDYIATSSDTGKTWSQVDTAQGLGGGITGIVQDDSGKVWVGTYGKGVSILENGIWRAPQQ
jgi:streptogramin lyase